MKTKVKHPLQTAILIYVIISLIWIITQTHRGIKSERQYIKSLENKEHFLNNAKK